MNINTPDLPPAAIRAAVALVLALPEPARDWTPHQFVNGRGWVSKRRTTQEAAE